VYSVHVVSYDLVGVVVSSLYEFEAARLAVVSDKRCRVVRGARTIWLCRLNGVVVVNDVH